MAVLELPVSASPYKYQALGADTLPTPSSLNVGDMARILDGPDEIWDGSSWVESGSGSGDLPYNTDGDAILVESVDAPTAEHNTDKFIAIDTPYESQWSATHSPAANTIATCTKATPGVGKKLRVRHISASVAWGNVTPAPVVVTVSLIQDSAGTPVTKWSMDLPVHATAGGISAFAYSVDIKIDANLPVTLVFSAAGGANTLEKVNMDGNVITEA